LIHDRGISIVSSAAASSTVRPGASRPIIARMVQVGASASSHHRYPVRSVIAGM
jgi:hypothetical protein